MTDENPTPRPAFLKGNWKWALLGLGVASAATAGVVLGNSRDDRQWAEPEVVATPAATAAAPPILAPAPVVASDIVRGVINPVNESTIASKMTARIVAMPYLEGQAFPAGALLARFDCAQISAELRAAEAATAAYRKSYETNVELDQFEAVGKNELAVSKANLGKAQAEAAAVSTQLTDCEVRAPFAGKVVEQIAHAREVAASGQPLLKIQSGHDVEMELIVPSNWLTWLRPGAGFAFKIDETGNSIRGKVKRFGASVDPVSKTIRVIGIVSERNGLVLPGMSGTATFDDARAEASPAPGAGQVASGKPS
jgi:membrane fusion protein, multidrug efflux system